MRIPQKAFEKFPNRLRNKCLHFAEQDGWTVVFDQVFTSNLYAVSDSQLPRPSHLNIRRQDKGHSQLLTPCAH